MRNLLAATALLAAVVVGGTGAQAAPVVYNTSLSGRTVFDNTITGVGQTVQNIIVQGGVSTYNYVDKNGNAATVSVTRPNGSAYAPGGSYNDGGISLSGSVWNIDPFTDGSDPIPGYNSGLKFSFSSPVNAFGFEIGDWATCCTDNTRPQAIQNTYGVPALGSGLWIAFNGGAATLPANALGPNDNPGYASQGSFTNFIGAIDSSGDFNEIVFFGDGFGEFLVAGGKLSFASVPIGSVGNQVPEPASLLLAAGGLGALVALRRRHRV